MQRFQRSGVKGAARAWTVLITVALTGVMITGCEPKGDAGESGPKSGDAKASASASGGASGAAATPSGPPPEPVVPFIKDDFAGALAKAKQEGKALFVDAWAPWCHTCLSMHHYVFTDPVVAPLGERLVFASIDTDRPENAEFAEQFGMNMWPTLFVIDPTREAGKNLVGYWPGAASARELVDFATASLGTLDLVRGADGAADGSPEGLLLTARAAQAGRDYKAAAKAYGDAVKAAPEDWKHRSEALLGLIQVLKAAKGYNACAAVGKRHIDSVVGAARPTDFARYLAICANELKTPEEQQAARAIAIKKLREITESPGEGMSVDDQSDALDALAGALRRQGEGGAAKAAQEKRLALMEKAAAEAPAPEVAAVYDYGRANAYVALGRAPDAVAMLKEREQQMPEAYEPPARLAGVYMKIQRWPEALTSIDRAIELSYGPRKLRYMSMKAEVLERVGDREGQVAILTEEVEARKKLVRGDANKAAFEDAQRRLERAKLAQRSGH